jgi:hypothetical protein
MQNNTYRIDYEFQDDQGNNGVRSFTAMASGPVIALNAFHRFVQHCNELDGDRKVIRTKLRHDQYRVKGLFVVYSSNALRSGPPMIASAYDLPNTPNPDLNQKKAHEQPKTIDSEFPFVEQLSSA